MTDTSIPEIKTQYSDTDSNLQNEIKLFDTWNNKYFFVKPGSSLRTYICGPTVYADTHAGHLKTYMTFDIIRRVLEDYFKIAMTVVENITDVDDKIIRATYQKFYGATLIPDDYDLNKLDSSMYLDNQHFSDYANSWEEKFFDDMQSMRVKKPNIVARVTEYIQEIFDLVAAIDLHGYAFEHDGSVYFHGTKYNNIQSENGSFDLDPSNPYNFSLLKKTKPYEPGWMFKTTLPTTFTKVQEVRPSWHSECGAISSKIYGYNYDIQFGGIDLKFPHHILPLFFIKNIFLLYKELVSIYNIYRIDGITLKQKSHREKNY
jgi:cysteinyl-tRNA synthetase